MFIGLAEILIVLRMLKIAPKSWKEDLNGNSQVDKNFWRTSGRVTMYCGVSAVLWALQAENEGSEISCDPLWFSSAGTKGGQSPADLTTLFVSLCLTL